MMPSAAITAVCGIGNSKSAQTSAIPGAHAQLPYPRSTSTASLASWDVGIVAQETSTNARTPITIRADLTWISESAPGPAGSALVRRLQPAAHAGLIVPIGSAEAPIQIRLLTRDHAVADRNRQRQREDQCPRASLGHADPAVDEKQAEIDGIACPAVDAGHHQHTRGLVRGYRCRCPGEVANTRG